MAQKKSGSMLCPNCGKLISVNADVCIHCGKKNPGAWQSVPFVQKILFGKLSYVDGIIRFCIFLYIVAILLDPRALFNFRNILQIFSPSGTALYLLGMTGSSIMAQGRWWTLITAIYLHGGILHILFNLLWIHQLGPVVEELFGEARFFLIFTISGVVGFLVSNFFGIPYTIGASGSIFGLLGAVVYYGRHRGGTFGVQIYKQTIQWVVILFLLGFMMSMVNNWAHAGGFIGGFLSAMALGYKERSPEKLIHRRLALLALILTGICFLMVIISFF